MDVYTIMEHKSHLVILHSSYTCRAPPKGDKQFQVKFIVSHYAGDVSYSITGFLDKNKVPASAPVRS
jgi:myosin heavy subunit